MMLADSSGVFLVESSLLLSLVYHLDLGDGLKPLTFTNGCFVALILGRLPLAPFLTSLNAGHFWMLTDHWEDGADRSHT